MAAAQGRVRSRSGSGAPDTRWAARLALVGIMGPVFYVVAIAAIHFLRPNDIVLYGNTISFYSVGPYGSISVAAFIALGLGALALAFGLRRTVMPSRSLRAGTTLVGLFGLGFCFAGIFRLAPNTASIEPAIRGEITTVSGIIHGLAAFGGAFCLIAGMMVLSRAFKRDERWHSFWIPSLILGLATLALFIAAFFIEAPEIVPCCPSGSVAWWGAIEFRAFFGAFVLWLLLASIRLHLVAKGSTQA
jgi:uncharacterized membrane protein